MEHFIISLENVGVLGEDIAALTDNQIIDLQTLRSLCTSPVHHHLE